MEPSKAYRRYLDDFEEDAVLQHWPGKTETESDNNLFCLLTMNHHPVHLDVQYCSGTPYGRILVAGTYVLSLVVGLTVPDISGAAIANLGFERVIHHAPVFIGDSLRAETKVLDVRRSRSKPDRGVLHTETTAFNQRNERVLSFSKRVLLPLSGTTEQSNR